MLTTGSFAREDGNYIITYEESEATGFEGARTTLLYEEAQSRVTLTRSGSVNTQLIVEQGKRHQCSYDVGFGSMIVGVNCAIIHSTLSDDGGQIAFAYSLDLNTALTSENQVVVAVFPEEKKDAARPQS